MSSAKNLIVAQTGGPSAVINSTLAGIIEEAGCWPEIKEVQGCINGFYGLLGEDFVNLSNTTAEQIQRLRNTPAAFLGSSRLHLTKEYFDRIPRIIAKQDAAYFLEIGGNGTMFAASTIQEQAKQAGLNLQVVGVPKTVDNDILEMDHTPGFGSAAKYVAQTTLDMGIDLWSMRTFEQVRILEVMGRNVGWLAAAAGLARQNEDDAPHLIYLPEVAFDEEAFMADLKQVYDRLGYAIVVIGEGIKDKQGIPVGTSPFANVQQGSQVFGGAAAYLADKVAKTLNIRARAQDLGMSQRCFTPVRSEVDEKEAYLVGRAAVRAAVAGMGGNMVKIAEDTTLSNLRFTTRPLAEVGGKEKQVPLHFYNQNTKQVTPEFIQWLKPLVGQWNPQYLRLEHITKSKNAPV